MNSINSIRRDGSHLAHWVRFLIFIQIFSGILFLIISPVTAITVSYSGTDPHIGWVKTIDQSGDGGTYTVIAARDGGSVTGGYTTPSPGKSNIYLIKTDTNGNKIWDFSETAVSYEVHSIIETQDKGYVVAGRSNTSTTNGILLMKLDSAGKK